MVLKPRVVISACLNGEKVRYDSNSIDHPFVKKLLKYIEPINVCPEISIGLSVPRDPIIVVKKEDNLVLYQPSTKKDLTAKMLDFSQSFLSSLKDIDGFLLKSKSPSCGVSGTKIFSSFESKSTLYRHRGLFAMEVFKHFPYYPIEDEGRLNDYEIRDFYLIKIFSFCRLRLFENSAKEMKELIKFHQENKLILMTQSQQKLKLLGRIVANKEKVSFKEVIKNYVSEFIKAFSRKPSKKSKVNTLMHAFGYVSRSLNKKEKEHFLNLLEKYKNDMVPYLVPFEMLKSFIYRTENEYLTSQHFFNPYPEELFYHSQ